MTRFIGQIASALILITASSCCLAQETAEAALQDAAGKIENEAQKASSDLRESVHENLETIQENSTTHSELRMARDALESAQEQHQASETPADSAITDAKEVHQASESEAEGEQVTRKSPLAYLKALPAYLQSLPERLPIIHDRGLIFFGRAELDFAYYSSGVTSNDTGFRVRSLRAGLAKAFKHNLSGKAEIDLTDGDSNFADLYIRHRHKRFGLTTVGNQRIAQSLVSQTSRISRTFMEEPLPAEAFALNRRLALGWDLHKPKGGIHATIFGADLNGSIGDSGYAGRVYFNPTRSRFSLFHVGASLVSENMSRKTRFFSHPESRVTSRRLVDTGIYDNIDRQTIGVLEVAGAKDSFMFRSEIYRAIWHRIGNRDPVFEGFYFQASWALTGEIFNYTQGKFIRLRPRNPRGAWEVAARISKVDLNDVDIKGGEERNLTIAANWYAPGNQFRVMANLIFVRTDEIAGRENPTILQLRAQFHW